VRARSILDGIPGHAKLLARVLQLGMDESVVVNLRRVGDSLFYLKADKGNDLRKLVMRAKDGTERVLVDPGAIPDAQGLHASIDHYKPSRDGRFVAYGLARGGDEITTEHVLDTTTGRELADRVERIWGEFTVSWLPDGTGFFYTQMASQGFTDAAVDKFLNMRLFLHRLGEPVGKDVAVLGVGVNATAPFAPQEFPSLVVVPGSDWVLASPTSSGGKSHGGQSAITTTASAAWSCVAMTCSCCRRKERRTGASCA
jgi:prolyl oligopeptidase